MVSKSGVQISISHMVSEYISKYIIWDGVECGFEYEEGDEEEGESEEDEEDNNEDEGDGEDSDGDEEENGEDFSDDPRLHPSSISFFVSTFLTITKAMDIFTNDYPGTQVECIIAPHEICESCDYNSGPTFLITNLKGPSETQRANDMSSGLERELKKLEINDAESEIVRLDTEELQQFSAQERSLLAPIRKLPQDVLQYLFVMCQRHLERDNGGMFDICNPNAFIRTITQICVYWQSLAYSCPELWSRISISHIRDTESKKITMVASFLERCILLSGKTTLHLFISSACTPHIIGDRCIQAIARCANRWEVINIRNGNIFDAIMAHIPLHVTFVRLKDLRLWGLHCPVQLRATPTLTRLSVGGSRDPGVIVSIQSAPLLFHSYTYGLTHLKAFFINYPWTQITHFESHSNEFTPEELSEILQAMPNLSWFTIYGKSNISKRITLPQLQTLAVECPWWNDTRADSLDVLRTPNLKSLYLDAKAETSTIVQFLELSDCSLRNLRLYRKSSLEDRWNAKQLNSLKVLSLNQPDSISQDLHWLTRINTASDQQLPLKLEAYRSVLPELETLDILYISCNGNVVEELIAMLQSRLPPIKGPATEMDFIDRACYLKSVTVIFEGRLNSSQENALRCFIRSDLVVQSGVQMTMNHGKHRQPEYYTMPSDQYSKDIVRNGIEHFEGSYWPSSDDERTSEDN
ncbi:hypothetical protein BDQ17DRAFT_1430485 [Cyathus striatus]|nr:hypothetical protein BDQ17DRAFT_1430485 [Cyathus striatus]